MVTSSQSFPRTARNGERHPPSVAPIQYQSRHGVPSGKVIAVVTISIYQSCWSVLNQVGSTLRRSPSSVTWLCLVLQYHSDKRSIRSKSFLEQSRRNHPIRSERLSELEYSAFNQNERRPDHGEPQTSRTVLLLDCSLLLRRGRPLRRESSLQWRWLTYSNLLGFSRQKRLAQSLDTPSFPSL